MSTYHQEESEDSFEDFLEWRRWKREKARTGGMGQFREIEPREARVAAPAEVVKAAKQASAPPQETRQVSNVAMAQKKDKEEKSTTVVMDKKPKAAVDVPTEVVAVPAQEGGQTKVLQDFNSSSDTGKKEVRNGILRETRAVLDAGKYITDAKVDVEIDTAGAATGRTAFTGDDKFSPFPAPYNTTAHFVKADAIDCALFLIEKKGVNPLVVIPADPKNIGGGFAGSGSLEEQLYRRSTALLAVEGDFKYDIPNFGAIYLPSIQVFRDSETKNLYQFSKVPRKVAFCLAASVEAPKYNAKGRTYVLDPEARAALEAKVTTILSVGLAKGHDAIVVPAFGCGFNKTPPQAVAAVFRDLLTGKFSNTYKHVTFSIIDDENTGKDHNPNGNLVPFQQEFLTVSRPSGGKCFGCLSKDDDGEKK